MLFFFQAEDGIRDGHVTGVQTCALPILGTGYVGLSLAVLLAQNHEVAGLDIDADKVEQINAGRSPIIDELLQEYLDTKRSEERRVGKECRMLWWWEHVKEELEQ